MSLLASSTPAAERAELRLDRFGEPGDLLVQEVEMREDRADHQRVMGLEATIERLSQRAGIFARSFPFARSARISGSVVP